MVRPVGGFKTAAGEVNEEPFGEGIQAEGLIDFKVINLTVYGKTFICIRNSCIPAEK